MISGWCIDMYWYVLFYMGSQGATYTFPTEMDNGALGGNGPKANGRTFQGLKSEGNTLEIPEIRKALKFRAVLCGWQLSYMEISSSKNGGTSSYGWMVYFMENPNLKWMMTGGTPMTQEIPK